MSESLPEKPDLSEQAAGVVRSAGMMSVATILSRLTGLVREIVIAQKFGGGMETDAFNLAFRLPNLARDLFAEGALSAAFVPTFTEYLTTKGAQQAARLANLVATAVIAIVGGLCLLGMGFAPWLVASLATGFQAVPGKAELSVHLTRIMFPFLLMVALAAQAMGVLNACNQFGIPALASSMFNIFSLAAGLLLGFQMGPSIGIAPIEGMAWGVVIGGACQLLWQAPSLYRKGFSFRPAFDWSHPGLRHIIRLMGPAILGGAAVQINVLVNTEFASHIHDPVRGANGPVSWLSWAFRFFQLPLGLFGVALASATTPAIARSLATGNHEEFRRTLSTSLGVVLLMTVPSAIGLVVLGDHMITAVFSGGKFEAYDARQTAVALNCYAIGLAGYAGAKIINPAFFALHDSRTPMLVSLASIVINFLAVTALLRYTSLGHAGLALSTSFVALFSFTALFWILRGRIGGIHGRALASSTVRIAMASLAMGSVVTVVKETLTHALGVSRWASVANLAVSIPAGLLLFYAACRLLGVAELNMAVAGIAAPLRRWLPGARARVGS
jgi:putative peptidoglycan lipid II flippase